MSQIIACKNENGIIVASDSKAVDVDPQGHLVEYSIKRLFQLTSHTAILTGGSVEGEKMCESLKDFVAQEKLQYIEDVYSVTLPFLVSQYEGFMRKACEFLPVDPIHQVHFILSGYSATNRQNPFQLYLLWTKMKLPQIDGDEISTTYSVPRLITLEVQLNQVCKKNEPLTELLPQIRDRLKKLSETNPDVAGPFSFALITRDGFKAIE